MYEPDPNAIAELCHVLPDGKIWRAVVYETKKGVLDLRTGRSLGDTKTFIPSGEFKTSKGCVKYIRSLAQSKYGHITRSEIPTPLFDTLKRLEGFFPESVVPECFHPMVDSYILDGGGGVGTGLLKCDNCPYRGRCGEPHTALEPETIPVHEVEEPQELFRARLAKKMKAKYG